MNILRSFAIGIIITLLGCGTAHAEVGQARLCWSPADWPAGWAIEGYNVIVSDPGVDPFVSAKVDAAVPPLNSSGNHVFGVAIPLDPVRAAALRFNVEAYGRDESGGYVTSEFSNSLDITCSEIGAVGGVNVCPVACVPADSDCDGRVTATDALVTLRIATGLMSAPECTP